MNKYILIIKKYLLILVCFLPLISCEDLILGPDPENTPTNNFNILWKEFDRYYPSFIVRNIKWDSLYTCYSSRINNDCTDKELWQIIKSLLYNFNDGHVTIYNTNSIYYNSSHRNSNEYEFNLDVVQSIYLDRNFHSAGKGNFTYGRFPGDSIGYLHIAAFSGLSDWAKDIDNIISGLSDVNTLIIDIRNNRGGHVPNFSYIAASFTDKDITFRKEIARNGPKHSDFTSPVTQTISPRKSSPNFTKQIILLTNRVTASASEMFALFFKQLPYSIQIGDSTSGSIGLIRGFQLPNGWLYEMPDGLTLTMDDKSLEGIGVVPDIYVRNTEEEIFRGYDRVLETALEYISGWKK
ncbi:MAG: hypothetical protein EHM58_06825 [Ignavibacteriae bacterium]|nr:MAG: hypothetical protein EHM58_06825 [Ignavibacteriota bacterium]